ncbi:hypothetical protein L6452_02422 [Arctium lappa]|uniref:Uncharacterized protein n=1 Tax=Arctium lappa TaxID=4217 RepID=A0ACB9FJK0_ARCLA|nr:hypothetical protein L6452_02422 [Arctium lappa]
MRTVRYFSQENFEISCYFEKVDETLKLGLQCVKVEDLFLGGLKATSMLSFIIVVIYGARLTITGSMSVGSLASFILYSLTVGTAVSGLSSICTVEMKVAGASRRVFPASGSCFFNARSRKEVSYGGINLKLHSGSKVALVGPGGGGKIASGQIASTGMVALSYVQKVSDKVSLAYDLMYNYMSRYVTACFGYDYILRQESSLPTV